MIAENIYIKEVKRKTDNEDERSAESSEEETSHSRSHGSEGIDTSTEDDKTTTAL